VVKFNLTGNLAHIPLGSLHNGADLSVSNNIVLRDTNQLRSIARLSATSKLSKHAVQISLALFDPHSLCPYPSWQQSNAQRVVRGARTLAIAPDRVGSAARREET